MRKPILTRQLNGWSEARLVWRLERTLLEGIAGGRVVVFATGGGEAVPSRRNGTIRWLLGTTVSERELDANAAPRARALAERRARLIIVGREVELSAARLALRALPLVAQEFPNVTLDVVADGVSPSSLMQRAGDSRMVDRVTIHGAVSRARVLERLDQADLFCSLPIAETEADRQALHEALARGLPVVTAPTSLAAMLTQTGCGVALRERTPQALAAAVHACLGDPARYRQMSAAALHTARRHSLERGRETIRAALHEAWGPLQSGPVAAPAESTSR
jgi:glycosyltransferase involved in cell wall biosynthesis